MTERVHAVRREDAEFSKDPAELVAKGVAILEEAPVISKESGRSPIHLHAGFAMTACGKDLSRDVNRAFKMVDRVRKVNCINCLKMHAADCLQQIERLKGRDRDASFIRDQLDHVLDQV